jgi:hypothetical protein
MPSWKSLGKIFDLSSITLPEPYKEYAQSPQAIILPDRIRIFFSSRPDRSAHPYASEVLFADFDLSLEHMLHLSETPCLKRGELGSHDEHGIFPLSPFFLNDNLFALHTGWSVRTSVPVETAIGLSRSMDLGTSFQRAGPGPILAAERDEPFLVCDGFARNFGNQLHMWYVYGTDWLEIDGQIEPERVYKIGHALSDDGVTWARDPHGSQLIPDVLGAHECQALPCVSFWDDCFHMVFCYREAVDFRTQRLRGYRLGYATSHDLISWDRHDEVLGLASALRDDHWARDMQCYPHFCVTADSIFLLLNGNEFGKTGFGALKLVP